jgi:hypothetical protein
MTVVSLVAAGSATGLIDGSSPRGSGDAVVPKRVHFHESVRVMLIPCLEELPRRLLWWSAAELRGLREYAPSHSVSVMATMKPEPHYCGGYGNSRVQCPCVQC